METGPVRIEEPWLAVVLSSILPGIGQIYTGRLLRGGILILLELTLAGFAVWSVLSPTSTVLVTACIALLTLAVWIWNLFDAHECARRVNPENFETERKRTKDAWLALFLADLIPGLGQLYVRKWVSGAVMIIACAPLFLIGLKSRLLRDVLWALFSAAVCYHAYVSAQTRREKSNKTISIIAEVILCSYLFNGFCRYAFPKYVAEAFKIPSTSMIPKPLSGGGSMRPTIIPGDRLFVRKRHRYSPKRGDVVAFKSPGDPTYPWIKRVAALPDETIEIIDGKLVINGLEVVYRTIESIGQFTGDYGLTEAYEVPPNHVFLIGDNTANSHDSRSFGAVPMSDVIGKAYKIYWPLDRAGPIE